MPKKLLSYFTCRSNTLVVGVNLHAKVQEEFFFFLSYLQERHLLESSCTQQCTFDKKMLIFSYISLVSLCLFSMVLTFSYSKIYLFYRSVYAIIIQTVAPSEEFTFILVQVDTFSRFQLKSRSFSEISECQGGSLWWFFVFYSETARTKLSFYPSQKVLLARVTFLHVLKMAKNTFLGHLTSFFSKTRANFLLPSPESDSTGKNLSNSVIISQMPKSMPDSVIRVCKVI